MLCRDLHLSDLNLIYFIVITLYTCHFFLVIGIRFLSWECQVFCRQHKHIERFLKTSENFRKMSLVFQLPLLKNITLNKL